MAPLPRVSLEPSPVGDRSRVVPPLSAGGARSISSLRDAGYTGLIMARSLPANSTGRFSPDGRWYWDGGRWFQVSPDGNWVWTGSQWEAVSQHAGPGSGGSNAPAVDVLVCFDTTGSMDDLIAPLVVLPT